MLELIDKFTIHQIGVYTIMLCFAIRGIVDFAKWCNNLYEEKFNKDYEEKIDKEEVERQCTILKEQYETLNQKIDQITDVMREKIGRMESQLEQLTVSDMHDIKSWIVEKHHYYVQRGWIDDFAMDTIEHRYTDYKAENGNSYIAELMAELRSLPHFPKEK